MFCIVAFIILSILGIFSATNRRLAKEAFDCVFRRLTFRPCNTGFDEKMKAKILGKVIMRSEKFASFINKRFEILSWLFFVIFLAAGVMGARGLYLFYTTGSCNGLIQRPSVSLIPLVLTTMFPTSMKAVRSCRRPLKTSPWMVWM